MRWLVAENPSTPANILDRLAKDKDVVVHQGTARNPRTPISVLERLSKDGNWTVRFWVSWNPSTPSWAAS